jgi:peptide/nickel transport system permease protein
MTAYLLRRLGTATLLLWAVATATFALVCLAPGDVASRLADPRIAPAARERWRRDFGLDRPALVRYGSWLGDALRGDLGSSWTYRKDVVPMLRESIGNTALLASLGLLVELGGGLALALVQLRRPHGKADSILSVASLAAYAAPTYAVALGLTYLFSYRLGWLPPTHMLSPAGELSAGMGRGADVARHLVLPALAIGITGIGAVARYLRGSLLDERTRLYVLAARARGCTERRALWAHALPNALLPLITMLGLSLPFLVSGSLVVEVIFAWPGMGQLMVGAAMARDVPLLMGGTLASAFAVIAGNLLADLAYALADPRVRLQ